MVTTNNRNIINKACKTGILNITVTATTFNIDIPNTCKNGICITGFLKNCLIFGYLSDLTKGIEVHFMIKYTNHTNTYDINGNIWKAIPPSANNEITSYMH